MTLYGHILPSYNDCNYLRHCKAAGKNLVALLTSVIDYNNTRLSAVSAVSARVRLPSLKACRVSLRGQTMQHRRVNWAPAAAATVDGRNSAGGWLTIFLKVNPKIACWRCDGFMTSVAKFQPKHIYYETVLKLVRKKGDPSHVFALTECLVKYTRKELVSLNAVHDKLMDHSKGIRHTSHVTLAWGVGTEVVKTFSCGRTLWMLHYLVEAKRANR